MNDELNAHVQVRKEERRCELDMRPQGEPLSGFDGHRQESQQAKSKEGGSEFHHGQQGQESDQGEHTGKATLSQETPLPDLRPERVRPDTATQRTLSGSSIEEIVYNRNAANSAQQQLDQARSRPGLPLYGPRPQPQGRRPQQQVPLSSQRN